MRRMAHSKIAMSRVLFLYTPCLAIDRLTMPLDGYPTSSRYGEQTTKGKYKSSAFWDEGSSQIKKKVQCFQWFEGCRPLIENAVEFYLFGCGKWARSRAGSATAYGGSPRRCRHRHKCRCRQTYPYLWPVPMNGRRDSGEITEKDKANKTIISPAL